MAATAAAQFQSDEKPTSLLSASTLVGPATVFVAAGLLVPAGDPVPLQLQQL